MTTCSRPYLQPVSWVTTVGKKKLYNSKMSASTGERQHSVVIGGSFTVHVGTLTDQELNCTEVSSTSGLH